MTGRPSTFTQDMADTICMRLMEGESMRTICKDDDMPCQTTVYKWLNDNEAFAKQYARARDVQADTLADEILQISDDGANDTYLDDEGNPRTDHDVVARSRLRVDSRKWLAGKLAPKRYGDRVTQEHTGEGGGPIQTQSTLDVTGLTDEQLRALSSIRLNGG